jgi:hypothetical protein
MYWMLNSSVGGNVSISISNKHNRMPKPNILKYMLTSLAHHKYSHLISQCAWLIAYHMTLLMISMSPLRVGLCVLCYYINLFHKINVTSKSRSSMHNDKWHLSWIEWYSILIDNWRIYTSKRDMFCYHYILQNTTDVLTQNTNIHQLTNFIYRHNIITIAIIRSLLVCHKFISMYQYEARKQQRVHTWREFIFYLMNW